MTFTSVLKAAALAVPLALASTAGAAPLIGSIVMGSVNVSVSGSLADIALFAPFNTVAGLSTGDIAAAGAWSGSAMTVSASALQAGGPANLTLSAAGFGTFTASSVRVVQEGTDSLDVMFVGSFDPQFGGATFSNGQAASMRLGVSRTGTVANLTGTLALAVIDTGTGTTPGTGDPVVPGPGTTPGGGSSGGGSTGGGSMTVVPEPASLALLGAGLVSVGLLRRRLPR